MTVFSTTLPFEVAQSTLRLLCNISNGYSQIKCVTTEMT